MTVAGIVMIAGLVILVALAAAWVLIPRRHVRHIVCPFDEKPRDVIMVGHPLDLDRWDDVVACSTCGAESPRATLL